MSHKLSVFIDLRCNLVYLFLLKGRIAYGPQQSWILRRNLESNICMSESMDTMKYYQTLKLCQLYGELKRGNLAKIGEQVTYMTDSPVMRGPEVDSHMYFTINVLYIYSLELYIHHQNWYLWNNMLFT